MRLLNPGKHAHSGSTTLFLLLHTCSNLHSNGIITDGEGIEAIWRLGADDANQSLSLSIFKLKKQKKVKKKKIPKILYGFRSPLLGASLGLLVLH